MRMRLDGPRAASAAVSAVAIAPDVGGTNVLRARKAPSSVCSNPSKFPHWIRIRIRIRSKGISSNCLQVILVAFAIHELVLDLEIINPAASGETYSTSFDSFLLAEAAFPTAVAAAAAANVASSPPLTPSIRSNNSADFRELKYTESSSLSPNWLPNNDHYHERGIDYESTFKILSTSPHPPSNQMLTNLNKAGTLNSSLTSSEMSNGDEDRSLILGIIIASIVIFIIGFIGNSVVILVIMKFTKTGTVTDIYILNLAFADLMFITGLIFLVTTMFISHWIFGNLMCKLYMATTSLNQFASSLLLVVMSFDRFLAVCHPIYAQRFRRLKRAKIICLCIWIACLILMTPILTFAKTNNEKTCAIFWPDYKSFNCEVAFTVYAFAIGFAVPLLLIAAFYLCVIRKLRLAARGQTLGSSRRSRSRENTNRRIEHLVIGIICTYTICWLPYWITQLCVSFIDINDISSPVDGFYEFFLIASCLSYTNSALNPILYAFLSDNFKRRCSEIFRSICSYFSCLQVFGIRGKRKQTGGGGASVHIGIQSQHHLHPTTKTTFTELDNTAHDQQHYRINKSHISNNNHYNNQNFKSAASSTVYNEMDEVSRQESLAYQTVILDYNAPTEIIQQTCNTNLNSYSNLNSPCPSLSNDISNLDQHQPVLSEHDDKNERKNSFSFT